MAQLVSDLTGSRT